MSKLYTLNTDNEAMLNPDDVKEKAKKYVEIISDKNSSKDEKSAALEALGKLMEEYKAKKDADYARGINEALARDKANARRQNEHTTSF